MSRILVADDNAAVRMVLERVLSGQGHEVFQAADGKAAVAELERSDVDLVLTDLRMEPVDGLEVLRAARRLRPETPVVIITAYGSIATALAALKDEAFDYVTKPLRMEEVAAVVGRALEYRELRRGLIEGRKAYASALLFDRFVAGSPAMRDIGRMITPAAAADIPLLITGEPGAGKESLARLVHGQSPRARRPFVVISCAEEPASFLDLHLFGCRVDPDLCRERLEEGLRQAAPGGGLCLRNAGLLPEALQQFLLDLLRKGRVVLSDGRLLDPADVRLIATDTGVMEEGVNEGSFDRELFGRLASLTLRMPPLRERREDVLPLVSYFLSRKGEDQASPRMTPEVMGLLESYTWPGNVREVEETAAHALQEAGAAHGIEAAHLPPLLLAAVGPEHQRSEARSRIDSHRARSLKAFLRDQQDEFRKTITPETTGGGKG